MVSSSPRILLIDSYDSFTHNLAHLLRHNIPNSQVYLVRNDELTYKSLLFLLGSFSAVVVGAGPGSPANDSDVGIIQKLWFLPESHVLPIFGVCLGFQSFVYAFGGSLRRMHVVKHGMISRIEHHGNDIFEGVGNVEATRYHSLCVDLDRTVQNLEIEPLAWAHDEEENGRVLMAARHRTKPFRGVQYHPESVCTRGGGAEIIRNFWSMALKWTAVNGRNVCELPASASQLLGGPWPHIHPATMPVPPPNGMDSVLSVSWVSLDLSSSSVEWICELFDSDSPSNNFVLLESAAKPGRFTVIGVTLPSTLSIQYMHPDVYVTLQYGDSCPRRKYLPAGSSIWDWIAAFMESRRVSCLGAEDIPFWGGLVGYLSYELGVAELGVPLKHRVPGVERNPDVNLIFVERSIVLDNDTGRIYVQSLIPGDNQWLRDTSHQLSHYLHRSTRATSTAIPHSRFTSPPHNAYIPQVIQCKEHLAAGSSYELCLTAPSTLHIPLTPTYSSWNLYTRLRTSNPAPHAAFLRLRATTLLCSSPERFLKWDRAGRCEMRPIKGTLRKAVMDDKGNKRMLGREDADELLGRNIKERAENLMIVDLVRHDLGGVVESAEGVEVRQLMGIEEYETVWQMVSAIHGTVSAAGGGWEALRRSLPPGSMTGAPKKRSVELLQDIEGQERGVYSGVCGYWCVGGGGDWAVIIRSCFRRNGAKDPHFTSGRDFLSSSDDRLNGDGNNTTVHEQDWTVGAGGAITALSDPSAEWEEMRTKLWSVGRAFGMNEL